MIIFAFKIIFIIFIIIPILLFIILGVLNLIGVISLSPLFLWYIVHEFFEKKNIKERSEEEIFNEAVNIVRQYDRVSVSLLQRRLTISYSQAEKILNRLQKMGVI